MTLIETERLLLRKLTVDDAAFMLDLLNQSSFIQFIGDRGVRTPDNIGSIRVLEKAGLKFERMIQLTGEEAELKLFAAES